MICKMLRYPVRGRIVTNLLYKVSTFKRMVILGHYILI